MAAAGGEHGKALGFRSCTRHLDMEVSSILNIDSATQPVSFIYLLPSRPDKGHLLLCTDQSSKSNRQHCCATSELHVSTIMMLCRYLQITQCELQSAQGLIQDKANRHAKELEERKTGPQQQRELLLKQLEEDKASRKNK